MLQPADVVRARAETNKKKRRLPACLPAFIFVGVDSRGGGGFHRFAPTRLENRQRHKIEEQEADLGRLKAEMASLKRDHDRLLSENGRFSDAVGELQAQVRSVR